MKYLFTFFIAVICYSSLLSQRLFFHSVSIEFEKIVYVQELFKELSPNSYEQLKNSLPQTSKTYHGFTGDSMQSIYKPLHNNNPSQSSIYQGFADKNIVYSDYKKRQSITQKNVFEQQFLVSDSLQNIKWKMTNDVRYIAGFKCRKAIGILNDSIGVFAFYTDQIMISGGPESICGLPGMILGVGVPKTHTTWFATKIELNDGAINAPLLKGKKVDKPTFVQSVKGFLPNIGFHGSKLLIHFLI